jgi:hypothetical protein
MRCAREGPSIRRIEERGGAVPSWFTDPPPAPDPALEQFMLDAFSDLDRDREIGMTVGAIPYTKMAWYFEHKGVDPEAIPDFCRLLTLMDDAWLAKNREESESKNRPTGGNRSRIPRK